MRRFSRHSERGQTFGTIVMILFLVVLGWLVTHWSIGYFGKTKAQKILVEAIIKNKEISSDEEMKKALIEALAAQGPIVALPEEMSLFRSQDGKQLRVLYKFEQKVTVPFTEYSFPIPFPIELDERLDIKTVF